MSTNFGEFRRLKMSHTCPTETNVLCALIKSIHQLASGHFIYKHRLSPLLQTPLPRSLLTEQA
ncbi:hypothetical protein AOY87_10355 [Escherichia coli]|nr:hypothetical protein AOY87_10355 [Escherichia coli]